MNSELRVVYLTLVLAGYLPAQLLGPQCSVSLAPIAAPGYIRAEGQTELLPPLTLTCSGAPTAAGQPVPTVNFLVQFNAAITNNPLFATGSSFADAYLFIDTPTPQNQILSQVSPSSNESFTGTLLGNGTGINYASGTVPNVFPGFKVNVNGIQFSGVPFDGLLSGTRTITISNIRVNASSLPGAVAGSLPSPITAQAFISGPAALTPINATPLTIATVKPGLNVSVTTGSAAGNVAYNPALLGTPSSLVAASFYVAVNEGFANAFKTMANEAQDAVGQVYNSESGFSNPNIPDPAGLTNSGTRIKLVFGNIPVGLNLYAPLTVSSLAGATPSTQAQLVAPGAGVGTTGLTQIPVTKGSATSVYEVTTANPASIDSFAIPIYLGSNSAVAAPTNITVAPSFYSTPGGAQFVNPFVTLSPVLPPVGFTVNSATGPTSKLSVTADPRPCYLGAPYGDPGNVCSPGQSFQLSVTSDSVPVTPAFNAVTTGGVTITGTLSGATPANASLQVTAPSTTAPGTYPQTLQFYAPGAGNTVPVTFNATVLPQNNPIIKPAGIVDAFSYQSGTISSGQPFALFSLNSGPAAGLVSGTLDSSGKLSTTVANTKVLFDGIAAPLLYVTGNQLSAIAPFGIAGKTSTQVQLVSNGLTSPAQTVAVSPASLSVASADGSGGNGGVIINKDGSLNSPQNRASVGDEVVIYASYGGPFANGVTGTDGRTTTGSPYPAPVGPVSVFMGAVSATNIPYFGNAPTELESVVQINVVIPAGVKPASDIPVQIATGDALSLAQTTIAVK